MTSIAAAAIVEWEGKILVGKKIECNHPRDLGGKWHLPGGKIKKGETPEKTIVREMMEEAGIVVEPLEILGIGESRETDHFVIWFRCKAKSGNIVAGDDLEEVRWVEKKEGADLCHPNSKILWSDQIENYLQK
jgi:8-oxo-dGTP diphosphatase